MKRYLDVNLQLFAQDGKTEKATPKKRQDARKKGQVLYSREIVSAMVLIFMFISIRIFGGYIYGELSTFIKKVMTVYVNFDELFLVNNLANLFAEMLLAVIKILLPVFAVAVVTGLITGYAQVGFLFTTETLTLKFSKINPINGLKRIFSAHGAVELLKAILKIAVTCYIAYSYVMSESSNVLALMEMDVMQIAVYIGTIAINVAVRICIALIILGVLDYIYQWWEYERNLKMTKHEIKEEYKQTEGNPEIKSKIKQKQKQISMRRMLQEVPKADVVITNPTHYAIALKYDVKVSEAPVVSAKGQDFIAKRIKEIALENNVQIVENKPLAKTLYETVEIGRSIPPELYQAVAEVLAFVYSIRNRGKDAG